MPRQGLAVVATVILILLSGCSSLGCTVGLGDCGPTSTPMSSTATPEPTSTDIRSPETNSEVTFGPAIDTSGIVLSLTDVPNAYNFTSESIGSEKTDQPSVIKYQHRTFTISNPTQAESLPALLISGITIYNSVDAAEQGTPGIIKEAQAEGMSSQEVQVTSETSVTSIQGTTETDRKVVILTHRQSNMVLYLVVASQTDFFADQATEWFVQMLGNL